MFLFSSRAGSGNLDWCCLAWVEVVGHSNGRNEGKRRRTGWGLERAPRTERRRTMAEGVAVAMEEREELEKKIREELEVEYGTRLETQVKEISAKLQENNQKVMAEAVEKIRKEMAPPSSNDVQKLLEQEYEEFTVEVLGRGKKTKTFTLRELPQKVEKKIYKKIKDTLVPFSTEIASISMNLLEGDGAKKIVSIMNTFDPVLDVMVGIATICLNPYGEDEEVTEEWVAENLSSTRIVKVVTAQIECNRMRDFFSLLFRGSRLMR